MNDNIEMSKQVPVMISYKFEGKRYSKKPDKNDYDLINKINKEDLPFSVPIEKLPDGVNINQPKKSHLFTHFHHFYTKRNLWTLAAIFNTIPKFPKKHSYWFNEDQLKNYHEYKQKMKLEEIDEIKSGQMVLFIQDEKSAIIWLNSFLSEPKEFQEIHPAYTKIANIAGDNVPDIKELLDKNFILEKGKYRRPQSEEEKLSVTEKWERELQREFDALLVEAKGSRKKIKECRKQAVIYGFEQCYKNKNFKDILTLASRLNKMIIENDSEITEFIEVAEMKEEGF